MRRGICAAVVKTRIVNWEASESNLRNSSGKWEFEFVARSRHGSSLTACTSMINRRPKAAWMRLDFRRTDERVRKRHDPELLRSLRFLPRLDVWDDRQT